MTKVNEIKLRTISYVDAFIKLNYEDIGVAQCCESLMIDAGKRLDSDSIEECFKASWIMDAAVQRAISDNPNNTELFGELKAQYSGEAA